MLKRIIDATRQDHRDFQRGCQLIGPPPDLTSTADWRARVLAGRNARLEEENAQAYRVPETHKGGWGPAERGFIDSHPVTFALGLGNKTGEVLLADGHMIDTDPENRNGFWHHHNHYGKGQGPNANVKDRGFYGGPGA